MKHKIVINDCYGGYALSDKAIDWLSEHGSERTRQFIAKKRVEANEKIKDYTPRTRVTEDNTKKFYVMDAVSFIDSDEEFRINLPKALGINPSEVEEVYNPKVICVV